MHNFSRLCYETNTFAKKHFLKKIKKLAFVSNFTVNELFSELVKYLNAENFFRWLSLVQAWFIISIY